MKELQEKGITLVALVVTIIILLILAGVTLNLALGEGGIFARAKNTADRYQAAQANEVDQLTKFEEMLNTYGNGGTSTGGGEETTNTVTPQPPEPATGDGSASDLSGQLGKGEDGNSSVIGKKVTGLPGDVAGKYDWEILYADESNIYLITKDYIEITDCPSKDTESLTKGSYNRTAYWGTTLLGKYAGSSDVTNDAIKKLNNDFFNTKAYTSADNNMKAVAYMLDSDIWKSKFVGTSDKVDYVIGGPTIELLFDAYNAKNGTKFGAKAYAANSTHGYKISKDNTKDESASDWTTSISSMIPTSESTFVITDTSNAYAYWVASPSARGTNGVMFVAYDGGVGYDNYNNNTYGFRPVVCLNSSVKLTEQDGGYAISE